MRREARSAVPRRARGAGEPPTWQALWSDAIWRVRASVWLGSGSGVAPGVTQRRIAAVIAVVALLWFLVFVVIGTLMA